MKYYITSDIHGFYTPFIRALRQAGWFEDSEPKKLIILGDLMDRGHEALALEKFIIESMDQNLCILIKGNHESLFEQFVLRDRGQPLGYHMRNGTVETAVQLTAQMPGGGWDGVGTEEFVRCCMKTPFYRDIIPTMVDYFETEQCIFTHGFLPSVRTEEGGFEILPDWRNADVGAWETARWINGMDAAPYFREEKTVYCGHWHASYGHSKDGNGPEFGIGAVFTPYYGKNIVALDTCTVYTGMVNCVVVENEPV